MPINRAVARALKSATTNVDVSAATAPSSGQVLTATSDSTATWQTVSGGYWDFAIKLSSDFVVTNSLLVDVTGFSFAATNGDTWLIQIYGSTTANNTTGDITSELVTTGSWLSGSSFYRATYYNGTGVLTNAAANPAGGTTALTGGLVINNGDGVVRSYFFEAQVVMSASGNIKFQIGNGSPASGRTSTLKAGTYMLARKLT